MLCIDYYTLYITTSIKFTNHLKFHNIFYQIEATFPETFLKIIMTFF